MKKELIVIGICTYNRPAMLETCLQSLIIQEIPENVEILFCVADNNSAPEHNISDVVGNVLKNHKYKYNITTKRGISYARNAVLECAVENNADFIAFIDDDEYAEKDWIINLYRKIKASGADAVQGKVIYNVPAGTIEYVKGLWQSASEEDAKLTYLPTGNVIFSKKLIQDWNLRFNELLALTGGEDLDFFLKSYDLGGKHIFTNTAVAYETVTHDRTSKKWQMHRTMRASFVVNYVMCLNRGRYYVLRRYLLKSIRNFITAPFYMGFGHLLSKEELKLKGLKKLYHSIGFFSFVSNIKINGYKKVTGN